MAKLQIIAAARMAGQKAKPQGFTIVELLVVIAVIGMLLSLLLPAIQHAQESARKAACKNNLRQIALATKMYDDAKRRFPHGYFIRYHQSGPDSNNSKISTAIGATREPMVHTTVWTTATA